MSRSNCPWPSSMTVHNSAGPLQWSPLDRLTVLLMKEEISRFLLDTGPHALTEKVKKKVGKTEKVLTESGKISPIICN